MCRLDLACLSWLSVILYANSYFKYISTATTQSGQPNISVAIIVPYRQRTTQLTIFTNYMSNFLKGQNSTASIYVIEQVGASVLFLQKRDLSDHATFREKSVTTGLVGQASRICSL